MFWGDDMNVEKNMFTIGEMAKSIEITRKIILNYEAKGLITPDVKDGKNGNRYYTVDTFTKIRTVRILQKLGLSLDEIHAYLDGKTDLLPLIRRLEAMRDEINLNIEKLYERANTNPTQITLTSKRFIDALLLRKVFSIKQIFCAIPQYLPCVNTVPI